MWLPRGSAAMAAEKRRLCVAPSWLCCVQEAEALRAEAAAAADAAAKAKAEMDRKMEKAQDYIQRSLSERRWAACVGACKCMLWGVCMQARVHVNMCMRVNASTRALTHVCMHVHVCVCLCVLV